MYSKGTEESNGFDGYRKNLQNFEDSDINLYYKDTQYEHPDTYSYRKPNISYAELIAEAIESSSEGKLTLKDIYSAISKRYPFYSLKKNGWQNSIRHNLSLNKAFYKVPRASNNPGKGSYWRLNHENLSVKPNYRTKRSSNRCVSSRFASEDFNSISEILGGNQTFLDNIGVTEMQTKPNVTSIFDGNLGSLYDSIESTDNETKSISNIFSFKK